MSVVEEDALISRIYKLIYVEYNYSLEELANIIDFVIKNKYFYLESIDNEDIKYLIIDGKKIITIRK